jgi:hypothetical protein
MVIMLLCYQLKKDRSKVFLDDFLFAKKALNLDSFTILLIYDAQFLSMDVAALPTDLKLLS